jgi:hypothetical protein
MEKFVNVTPFTCFYYITFNYVSKGNQKDRLLETGSIALGIQF